MEYVVQTFKVLSINFMHALLFVLFTIYTIIHKGMYIIITQQP